MLRQPFAIPAVLILVLALPLILGLIPPNRGYGIRTPKTISRDEDWYRANRYGGWILLLANVLYLVVAAILPNPPPPGDNPAIWLVHLGTFLGALIVSLLLIRRYIERL